MRVLMIGPANLGPYHITRFREIVKLIPEFTYLRIFIGDCYRPWSSDVKDVPCRLIDLESNSNLKRILSDLNPNIVILIGYNNLTLLRAAYWAKKHHIPTVVQSDSTLESRPRSKWKELVKSLIVSRLCTAAFVAGERSGAYVKSLGIPENAIWYGADVVDNDHFAASAIKWHPPETFPPKLFLTVARFSPEKNLVGLLKAFEIYRDNGGSWGLVIVGTGPMEQELKNRMSKKLSNVVFWYGWASYKELPALYQGASCLIIPSIFETWGLVVNEALAAGLPVLASKRCGCLPELCHDGLNGYSFDPLNIQQLSDLMLRMSSEQMDRNSIREASKQIIGNYTAEKSAQTVFEMCNILLKNKLNILL